MVHGRCKMIKEEVLELPAVLVLYKQPDGRIIYEIKVDGCLFDDGVFKGDWIKFALTEMEAKKDEVYISVRSAKPEEIEELTSDEPTYYDDAADGEHDTEVGIISRGA